MAAETARRRLLTFLLGEHLYEPGAADPTEHAITDLLEVWDALLDARVHITKQAAELAALKARRCDACMFWWHSPDTSYRPCINLGRNVGSQFHCASWEAKGGGE